MQNIIWRNRANTGLGLLVVLLALFSGFHDYLDTIILVIIGVLIFLFSFTGNRYVRVIGEPRDTLGAFRNEESFVEAGPVGQEEVGAIEDSDTNSQV